MSAAQAFDLNSSLWKQSLAHFKEDARIRDADVAANGGAIPGLNVNRPPYQHHGLLAPFHRDSAQWNALGRRTHFQPPAK